MDKHLGKFQRIRWPRSGQRKQSRAVADIYGNTFAVNVGGIYLAGPDLNSVVLASLAPHFVNAAGGNFTRVAGSSLIGAGRDGRNIGADGYGPNWSPT